MLLNDKTAVITGSLQGIGRATLDVFAKEGADIFACCQKETEEFASHINSLRRAWRQNHSAIFRPDGRGLS